MRFLMLSACVTPEAEGPAAAAGPTATQQQWLDDVRTLSADDMQGRDTGSPGGEMARNYIVGRMEALGVAPSPMGRLQPWEAQGRTRAGPKTYNDRRSVERDFDLIFTPHVRQAILDQRANQLFTNYQGAMIGAGEVWFDESCANSSCSRRGPVRIRAVNP